MLRCLGLLLVLCGLAACGPAPVQNMPSYALRADVQAEKIADLAAMIRGLGPGVDPVEAQRIAEIAVRDPLDWAEAWQVVDPPLIHNMKVNSGLRPRGLCNQWADDLQARLAREGFETVDWHRAIANHDTIRIEHSTLIVSAIGADMADGIVLDPWRLGRGRLFFAPVTEDTKYDWWPRQEVFAWKRARRSTRAASGKIGTGSVTRGGG